MKLNLYNNIKRSPSYWKQLKNPIYIIFFLQFITSLFLTFIHFIWFMKLLSILAQGLVLNYNFSSSEGSNEEHITY
jgi:hypothetical protein